LVLLSQAWSSSIRSGPPPSGLVLLHQACSSSIRPGPPPSGLVLLPQACLRMQKQLENKCEEVDRRNNLRIYSVPEKCEGNNMMDFVENLIREKLDVSGDIPIERAHRATGHLTGHSDRPRSIIVRFQNYN
ncbi:hypothetical protein KUCAC02_007055, partial [Chaenocephalus aceratus]